MIGFLIFDIIVWIVGYIILFVIASFLAPRLANSIAGKISFGTAMVLTPLLILIIGGSFIAIALCIILNTTGTGTYLVIGSIIFAIIINIATYLISPYIINFIYRAQEDPALQNLVNEVANQLKVKPPKALVVDMPPNAFAYGNFLTGKFVAVSRELINILDREELKAVIGHEIGHHKHKDNFIMLCFGLIPSIIYFIGRSAIETAFWEGLLGGDRESAESSLILIIVGIVAVVVTFILQLLILTFSRLREYYADIEGVKASSKIDMASALAKIHLYYQHTPEIFKQEISNNKLKTLLIYGLVNAIAHPFYDSSKYEIIEKVKSEKINTISEILSTHPPIPKRIKFIENLKL